VWRFYIMMLRLTGEDEQVGTYQDFPGRPLEQMPRLITLGYQPMSATDLMARQISAPLDVCLAWASQPFYTADAAAYNKGEVKIVLNATLLRDISQNSKVCNGSHKGALILSDKQWRELQGEDILHLSAEEMRQAHDHRYIYQRGILEPANEVVEKVWRHLAKNVDLKKYAQIVADVTGSKRIMGLTFDLHDYRSPVLRPWVMGKLLESSNVHGDGSIVDREGCLVGKAVDGNKFTTNGGLENVI